MSSYTTFEIDGYELLSSARYASLEVLTVFRETDRYLRVVHVDDSLRKTPVDKPVPTDLEVDEEDEQISVGYAAPAWIVRDRLDVMGFTLGATRSVFERGIRNRLERLMSWREDRPADGLWDEDLRLLPELSFDRWVSEFRTIVRSGATKWTVGQRWAEYSDRAEQVAVSEMGAYLLKDDGYPFRFPNADIRFFLRAVVEACGASAEFRQDLDEVVAAGYYGYDEPIAENASAALEEGFPSNARIVVLTEGVTDSRALQGALGLLYPHLVDYFGFMDFEGAAIAGGAGPLVATVKAFAGAGIANRVVALFDNDTAARAAVRGLRRVELPPSIRIAHYPALPLGAAYPTRGPGGLATMDVNGLAGSLELYFGEDVLRGPDGKFTPVVWRNYEDAISSYHGEVADKPVLQQRFNAKLDAAAKDPSLVTSLDWSGMRLILSELIGVFSNEPGEAPDD